MRCRNKHNALTSMANRPDETGNTNNLRFITQPKGPKGTPPEDERPLDKTLIEIDLDETLRPYTPEDERRRLAILEKLTAQGKKSNTLELEPPDRKIATDLTRRRYATMESSRQATNRLFAAINESFSQDDAKELKDLARHVIGYYLNTSQYHSAPHALGMAREVLKVAEIAGYRDPKLLKALVIVALYHDTGNGLHPVPPVGKNADEVQGFKILMKDIKIAEKIAELEAAGEISQTSSSSHPLNALRNIRKETITLEEDGKKVQYPMINIIAACIAATVFRDRFAEPNSTAFNEYVIDVLEILYGKKREKIPVSAFPDMTKLMHSGPAWLAKNADISGSTNTANVLQANLTNRLEDYRRGMAKDAGPEGYHGGFVGFISGVFHSGAPSASVEQARQGAPFYMPDGDQKASEEYGRQRLAEEKERFEQLIVSNKPMLVALYAIMYRGLEEGKNILEWPISQIRRELERISSQPGGLQYELTEMHKRGVMTKEQDTTLTLQCDEKSHPLLFDQTWETKSIADLTPGAVNRIFTPNAANAPTKTQQRLATIIATMDEQPTWEQIEALPGVGKLTSAQREYLDEKITPADGKEAAKYWNRLRQIGLSLEQIRALTQSKKIDLGHRDSSVQIRDILEELESKTTIDERPCLSRLLEVADLSPDTLRIETFPAGKVMIEEGERPERVLVIFKGRAMVKLSNGQDVILGQGSIMGEISALTGKGAVASVIAGNQEDVMCISLPSHELAQNYQNEDLRLNAARLAAKRLGLPLSTQPSA
jgi:CRP-like cAMP-binding protein